MTDTDHQVATLLRAATADLGGPDPATRVAGLVAGGVARGRRTRLRRRVGTAIAALAVVVVAGVGLSLGGQDTRTAVDPVEPADRSSAPASPTGPRPLAVRAADLPDLLARLMPGDVEVRPAKTGETSLDDDYDVRDQRTSYPATEPGPGVAAYLTWNGVEVSVSVGPTDPALGGSTALERCRASGAPSSNGECVATPDGGALQETTFTSDEGAQVQVVSRWAPDLWEVSVMTQGDGAASPSVAQLEAVVASDAWWGS